VLLSILFAIPVLLFSIPASTRKHGRPIIIAYEGNCKSMTIVTAACSNGQQQQVYDTLLENCKAIGATGPTPLNGAFDGGGFHFKYLCTCAHGDTGLPFVISTLHLDAQATYVSQC
jgi:hypothetical protein